MFDKFLGFYLHNFYFMSHVFAPGIIIRTRFHFRDILYCVHLLTLLQAIVIPVFTFTVARDYYRLVILCSGFFYTPLFIVFAFAFCDNFMPCVFVSVIFTRVRFHFPDILCYVYLLQPLLHALVITMFTFTVVHDHYWLVTRPCCTLTIVTRRYKKCAVRGETGVFDQCSMLVTPSLISRSVIRFFFYRYHVCSMGCR